jgi:hypothetical protein
MSAFTVSTYVFPWRKLNFEFCTGEKKKKKRHKFAPDKGNLGEHCSVVVVVVVRRTRREKCVFYLSETFNRFSKKGIFLKTECEKGISSSPFSILHS